MKGEMIMLYCTRHPILCLIKAFELIFKRPYLTDDAASDKILINNIAFILAVKGFTGADLGSYGFRLWQTGVTSSELSGDINKINLDQIYPAIELSDHNIKIIDKIRKAADKKPETVGMADWIKVIASIIYIKEYVIPSDAVKTALFKTLREKYIAFSDDELNQEAYCAYEELMHVTDPHFIIQTNFVKVKSPMSFRKIIANCTDPCGSLTVRTASVEVNGERQYKYGFTGNRPILGLLKDDVNDPCVPIYDFDDFVEAVQSVLEDEETLKILIIEHDANYVHCPIMTNIAITSEIYTKNKLMDFGPDWLGY